MIEQPVLRVTAKFLIPLIMLFALYVQFHGEYSPGGGFQAGVIFGSALTFYGLVFGVEQGTRVLPFTFLRWLSCVGVLLFGAVGVAAVLRGGAFLDYNVLAADPVAGQHLGILLVELGVGLTVAGIVVSIFFAFAERERWGPPDNGRLDDPYRRVVLGAIPIDQALSSSKQALVHRQASRYRDGAPAGISPPRDSACPLGPSERGSSPARQAGINRRVIAAPRVQGGGLPPKKLNHQ